MTEDLPTLERPAKVTWGRPSRIKASGRTRRADKFRLVIVDRHGKCSSFTPEAPQGPPATHGAGVRRARPEVRPDRFKHLVHGVHGDEVQSGPDCLVDLLQILDIVPGDDDRMYAAAQGGHGFLLQTANGQHPAPEGHLAGHGYAAANRPPGQRRQHGGGDGDSRRWAVLGHGSLREVDMDVLGFIEVPGQAQLLPPAAQTRQRRLGGFPHHGAQVAGQLQACRCRPGPGLLPPGSRRLPGSRPGH